MLNNAFLCSLAILFIHTIFQEGHIFGKIGESIEDRFFYKPLIGCLVCMIWWAIPYAYLFTDYGVKQFMQFALTVSGINVLISSLIGFLNDSFFHGE